MKINEPKTPWHEAQSDDEEEDPEIKKNREEMRKKMTSAIKEHYTHGGIPLQEGSRKRPHDESDEEDSEEDNEKKAEFKKLRNQHYKGEFVSLSKLKALANEEGDEQS